MAQTEHLGMRFDVTPEQIERLAVVEAEVKSLKTSIDRLSDAVDSLTAVLNQGKGAWGLAIILGGAASFLVGGAVAFWKLIH